jgi:hypothetical protein
MKIEKKTIDIATKDFLYNELRTKDFITNDLQTLLQKPFYYTLQHKHLLLKCILIPKFNLKDAIRLLNRLVYISKKEEITHSVHFWIIPCASKRYFPETKEELFNEKHINGGYTYIMRENHDVFIYRLEDLQKTAIHELLHNSKIHKENIVATSLLDVFQISPDSPAPLLINEASIEAWAMYYHLKCIARENKIQFKDLFQKELKYSLQLSHKLTLYHTGLWKEYTNAYAYIRLKTCIMFFWSFFIKSIDIITFLKTYNMHPTFLDAIYKSKIPIRNSCKITLYGSK